MHYQVPQYLNIEDKIIGPLTIKQFIYLLLGGGVIFLLFSILKFSIFIIVAIPVALFTLLATFYKTNNQKFTQIVSNFLGFISKPNIYTWKKSSTTNKKSEEPVPKIIKRAKPKKKAPENKLQELWWKVEIRKNKKNL